MLNGCSIVLLGSFNPGIFHPNWFERFKVVTIQEAQFALGEHAQKREIIFEDNVKIEISDAPGFSVNNMKSEIPFKSFNFSASHDRIDFRSRNVDNKETIIDAATRMMSILEHIPISAIGMNYVMLDEIKNINKVLDKIFPTNNDLITNALENSYEAYGNIVANYHDYKMTIIIQKIIQDKKEKLVIDFNCHYTVESTSALEAVQLIKDKYIKNFHHCDTICKKIITG